MGACTQSKINLEYKSSNSIQGKKKSRVNFREYCLKIYTYIKGEKLYSNEESTD